MEVRNIRTVFVDCQLGIVVFGLAGNEIAVLVIYISLIILLRVNCIDLPTLRLNTSFFTIPLPYAWWLVSWTFPHGGAYLGCSAVVLGWVPLAPAPFRP